MDVHSSRFEIEYEDEPGRAIRGVVERPAAELEEPLPWLLLVHGFKGFMDWGFIPLFSRGLASTGFCVVRCNLSGSGVGADGVDFSDLGAFAKDTYGRQLEDKARVYNAVRSGELGAVDPERCGFFGHSRGGGMGIVHAADHPYKAVVTWAAIDDADRFGAEAKQLWREQGYLDIPNLRTGQTMRMDVGGLDDFEAHADRYDILAAASRVEAPTLVVHGTADETVGVEAADRLASALPNGRKLILEGAGHTLEATHPLTSVPPALGNALAATTEHFLTHT